MEVSRSLSAGVINFRTGHVWYVKHKQLATFHSRRPVWPTAVICSLGGLGHKEEETVGRLSADADGRLAPMCVHTVDSLIIRYASFFALIKRRSQTRLLSETWRFPHYRTHDQRPKLDCDNPRTNDRNAPLYAAELSRSSLCRNEWIIIDPYY